MRQLVFVTTLVLVALGGCVAPTNETTLSTRPAVPEGDAEAGLPGDDDGALSPDEPQLSVTGPSGTLRVLYVNVGQGDGTIWHLPDGSVIVYDCGPPAGSSATNPMNQRLRGLGFEAGAHIHALIASHGHLDHIGGCEEILADYAIDHLYDTWYEGADTPSSYDAFRQQVRQEGGVLHNLVDDDGLSGDVQFRQWDPIHLPADATGAGVSAQIMWPRAFEGDSWDEIAESSIAVRLSFGSMDLCFQGDLETAQEARLASYDRGLNCEVYLVGHHGSRYASSSDWLAKMDPEYAVASFGDNGYGHPTAEALCRVQAAGAAIYATHRLETITVETDGSTVTVTPATPEETDYCAPGADYWTGPGTGPAPDEQPAQQPAQPPSDPPGPLTVSASVSDVTPCQRTTVTISVHVQDADGAPVGGANVETTWHYKSSTPTEAAITNSQGDASVSRNISTATAGYTVRVDVVATAGSASGSTSTSFTPMAC